LRFPFYHSSCGDLHRLGVHSALKLDEGIQKYLKKIKKATLTKKKGASPRMSSTLNFTEELGFERMATASQVAVFCMFADAPLLT